MVGVWANARTAYHALTADKPPPIGSKQERDNPPEPNWLKQAQAKAQHIEHAEKWWRALTSPQHFGAFIKMPHILGEPQPDEVKTAAELRRDPDERKRQYRQFLDRFQRDVRRRREAGQGPKTIELP